MKKSYSPSLPLQGWAALACAKLRTTTATVTRRVWRQGVMNASCISCCNSSGCKRTSTAANPERIARGDAKALSARRHTHSYALLFTFWLSCSRQRTLQFLRSFRADSSVFAEIDLSPMLSSIAAVDAEPDKVANIRLPAATCMSSRG